MGWCTQWHTRSLTPFTLLPMPSASTILPRCPPTPTSTESTTTTPAPLSSRMGPTTPLATSPRSPMTALLPTLMLSVLDTEWSATLLPIPLPMPWLARCRCPPRCRWTRCCRTRCCCWTRSCWTRSSLVVVQGEAPDDEDEDWRDEHPADSED